MLNIHGSFMWRGAGKIAIVASRFNEFIVKNLIDGAVDCLMRHGLNTDDISIHWVPGSFEIPLASKKIALTKRFDAVICLGAIIRGDTPHFEYLAAEVTKGIANVSLETGTPVILGILTTDTIEQAIERSGTKAGNRGFTAALDALEMINLVSQIEARVDEKVPLEKEQPSDEVEIEVPKTEKKTTISEKRSLAMKKMWERRRAKSALAEKRKAEIDKEELSKKRSEAAKQMWIRRRAQKLQELKAKQEKLREEAARPLPEGIIPNETEPVKE